MNGQDSTPGSASRTVPDLAPKYRTTPLHEQKLWRGSILGFPCKIVWWKMPGMGNPVWNYYVYIPETLVGTEKFDQIWLTPKVVKLPPESRGWLKYDYTSAPFINVDAWHGGITYYEKHGEVPGYRSVELGCDYNHLWDEEGGFSATLESVMYDLQQTVAQLFESFGLVKETPPTVTVPAPASGIGP